MTMRPARVVMVAAAPPVAAMAVAATATTMRPARAVMAVVVPPVAERSLHAVRILLREQLASGATSRHAPGDSDSTFSEVYSPSCSNLLMGCVAES